VRAIRLLDTAATAVIIEENIPAPQPGPNDLLIRVLAAGVTPTELAWYPTSHRKTGEKRTGAIPGHEFSGVVAAAGEQVQGVEAGQEVYGMNDWFADGAMAEYCLAQPSGVAPKPPHLSHVEAAAVPIGALTAWQGLFDRAGLRTGERVLVHGGAGAVGVFAIQLARLRGAHVVATASARNIDFVAESGAEQVIDYRSARFEERVRDVDVVFDTVGGETLQRSWDVLKPGGRMVTIAGSGESPDVRIREAFFIVEPNQKQLIEIGQLLEAGDLRPVVDAVAPLSQASAAFRGELKGRVGRGKVVIAVS